MTVYLRPTIEDYIPSVERLTKEYWNTQYWMMNLKADLRQVRESIVMEIGPSCGEFPCDHKRCEVLRSLP